MHICKYIMSCRMFGCIGPSWFLVVWDGTTCCWHCDSRFICKDLDSHRLWWLMTRNLSLYTQAPVCIHLTNQEEVYRYGTELAERPSRNRRSGSDPLKLKCTFRFRYSIAFIKNDMFVAWSSVPKMAWSTVGKTTGPDINFVLCLSLPSEDLFQGLGGVAIFCSPWGGGSPGAGEMCL